MWITARVKRTAIGSPTPGRANLTAILLPGAPFSASETWSIFQPRVDAVSTCTMRSPSRMPAFSADAVTRAGAVVLGGGVREDAGDGDVPLHVLDLHPDAAVAAARLRREAAQL